MSFNHDGKVRRLASSALLLLLALGLACTGQPADPPAPAETEQDQLLRAVRIQTYAYKTVDGLQIKADVHRFDDDVARPVVVWIHGGALIFGNRAARSQVKNTMLDAGYVVVSIDYRLAPETKLPLIIEDLEDALAWVHTRGPDLFGADPSKIAVMGTSAGGYLTLTAGFRAEHRPAALISFWGYGDLVGPWYSEPSLYPRHNPRKISSEEAYAQVDGPPVSEPAARQGDGIMFYNYTRQTGTWPQAVSGWDPHTEAENFFPFMPVKNVTSDYPPTMLVHGTEDTDVPYEQSVMMAEQLELHGVTHELVTIPGGEHGLGGGDPELIAKTYEDVLAWVNRYLR
jgi:acetyl esterase/lipase